MKSISALLEVQLLVSSDGLAHWLPSHHRLSNSDPRSDQCYLALTRSLSRAIFGFVAVLTCRRFDNTPPPPINQPARCAAFWRTTIVWSNCRNYFKARWIQSALSLITSSDTNRYDKKTPLFSPFLGHDPETTLAYSTALYTGRRLRSSNCPWAREGRVRGSAQRVSSSP